MKLALLLLIPLLLLGIGIALWPVYVHGKMDANGAKLWQLARLISIYKPPTNDPHLIQAHLPAHYDSQVFVDAWNRPIIIRITLSASGEYHYEVRSLGRDNKVGPCVVGPNNCKSIDADWIIRDDELVEE